MRFSLIAAAILCLPAFANSKDVDRPAEKVGEQTQKIEPVASWSFDELPDVEPAGQVGLSNNGPAAPEFPDFAKENSSLHFPTSGSLRIDDHPDGRFDFDNGDAVTLEAWVNLKELRENAYVIGKGRTQNAGMPPDNQNWALRLRSHQGKACVNFLFRSRDVDAEGDQEKIAGDWHRWTATRGFVPGTGWHHIAVSYRFGEPESIQGYLDGQLVDGTWDMGGPTEQPPVVDDDQVWIGASMGGNQSTAITGEIDELAIYRGIVPSDELQSRYRYVPQPPQVPTIPKGRVAVQLFGPVGSIDEIPRRTGDLLTEWVQDELAFVRLPHKYDSWGIRDDWGKTLLVRAFGKFRLGEGEHRLMIRSRGFSRLTIDDQVVGGTGAHRNRGGAHHVVDPLPGVPVPGMRPHAMNDHETVIDFQSDGSEHLFVYETILGGPRFRTEFGEACVAIQSVPDTMYSIVSSQNDFGLTDVGWEAFFAKQSKALDALDTSRRRAANEQQSDYWNSRHVFARENLLSAPPEDFAANSIDRLIGRRLAQVNQQAQESAAASEAIRFYQDEVQPILSTHCYRCHGEKQQGELSLLNRDHLLRGGESEVPAIVPGKPEESQLFELISADPDDYRMPPKGDGLTAAEVDILKQWIVAGAPMATERVRAVKLTPRADDLVFLRRAFIDTLGVAPTVADVNAFLADESSQRRQRVIDRLLRDDRLADNWVGYWQDVFAENPNLLKPKLNNTGPFRWWIHEALRDNKPLDRFATELIMMRGSTWNGGTAGFAIASENDVPMAAKAHVLGSAFLGVQLECARCHDAPYHEWKQADLFQMAAMLRREPLKLPASSTVPTAFFEKQQRESLIAVTIEPGSTIAPEWPFPEMITNVPDDLLQNPNDSRERLAARVTLSRRFAEVLANRVWKRLMGQGIVEPVDDWEGNSPSDPALLAFLADTLIDSDYDLRELCRVIMNSEAYQREAIAAESGSSPSERLFAGPYRRRMTAEQIVDTAFHAVGREMRTEPLTMDLEGTLPAENFLHFGYPRRAWEFTTLANERDRPSLALPRIQAIVDVLKAFGWRDSRPEPSSYREETPNLIQPGVLANDVMGTWLTRLSDDSELTTLMLREQTAEALVDRLFLSLLTRYPSDEERDRFVTMLEPGFAQRIVPAESIEPAPEPRRFRYVSWSNHLNSEANIIKVEMEAAAREGDPPTRYLTDDWRQRAEDAIWALLNSPEMVIVP